MAWVTLNWSPIGLTDLRRRGLFEETLVVWAADEIGFHAVEDRHYATDVHATVLRQLGLNTRQLSLPGRKRIEKDDGQVIHEIIA